MNNLEPKNVFKYFLDICKIPHGSGNLDGIVSYLISFAKDRNLEYIVDDTKNVIIKKNGSGESVNNRRGELCESVILQAHIDMVCVKTATSTKDMSKEGLDVYTDGNYLRAKDTSLGGDDGIGVAIILAMLDDSDVKVPIEALFTADEETGMYGAIGVDGNIFKGKKLINIDSEEEGELTVSCAGGSHLDSSIPITRMVDFREPSFVNYTLKVTGLLGGHSGMEIHKGRANAIIEIAYILKEMSDEGIDYNLLSIEGGRFENVICPEAKCEICVNTEDEDKFKTLISKLETELKKGYILTDKDIKIELSNFAGVSTTSPQNVGGEQFGGLFSTASPLDKESTKRVNDTLIAIPQGLLEVSQEFINLPWTSVNLGVIKTEEDKITLTSLARSNEDLKKNRVIKKYKTIFKSVGGKCEVRGEYPAWQYKKDSKLKEDLLSTYRELYGRDMKVVATHGGLECGLLLDKMKGLEAVSIGPTMKGVHSADETLYIDTVGKVYDFLLKYLEKQA